MRPSLLQIRDFYRIIVGKQRSTYFMPLIDRNKNFENRQKSFNILKI